MDTCLETGNADYVMQNLIIHMSVEIKWNRRRPPTQTLLWAEPENFELNAVVVQQDGKTDESGCNGLGPNCIFLGSPIRAH